MSERLFLGIDTSNYKTSIAVTDELDNILFEKSELLEVEQGALGLRQSTAFFKHSIALPQFIDECSKAVDFKKICAISYSSRPRRIEGSYMPVFLAGKNASQILSSTLNVPLYAFSHQEGHAHAVISSEKNFSEFSRCIMYHLSGGTSEILLCERDSLGYKLDIIGGTKDISIGQLIDRIGVKLGYKFPAGQCLDEIAETVLLNKTELRIKHKDGFFNLSGIETSIVRKIDNAELSTVQIKVLITDLFYAIARLICETATELSRVYNTENVVIVGGVASSKTIRNFVKVILDENDYNVSIKFGDSKLSGDNAVGIARLGRLIHTETK